MTGVQWGALGADGRHLTCQAKARAIYSDLLEPHSILSNTNINLNMCFKIILLFTFLRTNLAQRLLTCNGEVTKNFEKDLTERIFYTTVVLWKEEMECFWGSERLKN